MVSTVATSTIYGPTSRPAQKKAFYANGRFWVFYHDGTNIVFKSSTDGITWSSATTIGVAYVANFFSLFFDGTYVHYARTKGFVLEPIYYRRGIPNSDGSITWSDDEQIAVINNGAVYLSYPIIVVDAAGHAWIGYRRTISDQSLPWITKNADTDGTWTDDADFPYQLEAAAADIDFIVLPVLLTSGKLYVLYSFSGIANIDGRLYDPGTGWGDKEIVITNTYCNYDFSAIGIGDDVHLVYLVNTTWILTHKKRTYITGTWGPPVTVHDAAVATYPCLAIDSTWFGTAIYCFWTGDPTAKHVYYKRYVNGSWDASPTDWKDETDETLLADTMINCYYKSYNGRLGVCWTGKTSSPYDVRFDYLLPAIPLLPFTIFVMRRDA